MIFRKILKYELANVLRNRWILMFTLFVFALAVVFLHVTGDFSKSVLSLGSVLNVIVPLAAILFSVVYIYYSDAFTELMLAQPILRSELLFARFGALCLSWLTALVLALVPPFLFYGGLTPSVLLLLGSTFFLATIFLSLGLLVAASFPDRIRGIGAALALWLYFAIVHDSLILIALLALRDYPVETPAAVFGALNPIGLARLSHIVHHDASLLLSFSGAVTRALVVRPAGLTLAGGVTLAWLAGPVALAWLRFRRRDF